MIKLLWNTHNQTSLIPKKKEMSILEGQWGIYHKNNSDKWIYNILSKTQFKTIQSAKDLEHEDILIIVDSSVENKSEFYNKLKLVCSKIFLIHLGDEIGTKNVTPVYNVCNYIWRTFCFNKYFENNKIECIPLGYKSGVLEIQNKGRKYKWAFIGTPHKSSRHDLLFQFSEIKPFFSHKTKKFNEKIIPVNEMTEILASTEFIPCPNGFAHPETYRLYEALECGCIPIVENTYKYYDRLFPNNPFLKIEKWSEAKSILKKWTNKQIETKQNECKAWWNNYKIKLQNSIKSKVNT
tara:strand:+ start:600 stop:1481 length:882 start_codon:yes stop_codon:yes gene_type:complete